jgi:phosphopantetheinyl transferase
MITDPTRVYLFVFDAAKTLSTDSAIRISVREYCQRKALSLVDGMEVEIQRTKSGKPYLPKLSGIYISVSHSGKYLVCAVTNANVGVDIEQRKKHADESDEAYADRLCKIAKRFFHPDEASLVRTDPIYRFYEVFTAKESYVKFTGTGFDETMEQKSILPESKTLPSCHLLGQDVRWSTGEVEFWQTDFDRDYTLCICLENAVDLTVVNMA